MAVRLALDMSLQGAGSYLRGDMKELDTCVWTLRNMQAEDKGEGPMIS